jgi:hypothetical protein
MINFMRETMKNNLAIGACLAVFITAMLPLVQAVEYDTAKDTQQAWFERYIASCDIEELMARLLAEENNAMFDQELAKNGLVNCILIPLKWLANIFLKVLMLPIKLVINIMFRLLTLPIRLLSATFKLLLLPAKLLLLPLKIALIPLKVLVKIITFPFNC